MADVSIIILTRDRIDKLRRCLACLAPQIRGGDEVLIIDSGSKDGTIEAFAQVSGEAPGADLASMRFIRFIQFEGEGSWAEVRNLGIDRAANPLLAFLDDDCYPGEGWIEAGRSALEDRDACGGLVVPDAIESWPPWWDLRMGWLVGISVPGHLGPDAGRYFYPYTSNLWVRAEVARAERFQELGGSFGGVEEKKYETGREDAEFWKRLRIGGYRCGMECGNSELTVRHDIDSSRLDFDYLKQRAMRDAQAWARREGGVDALPPLAYQWWTHSAGNTDGAQDAISDAAMPDALNKEQVRRLLGYPPGIPSDADRARQRFGELMQLRRTEAIRALTEKLSAMGGREESATRIASSAKIDAVGRLAVDRAKNIARRIALASRPTKSWTPLGRPPNTLGVVAAGYIGDLLILQSCLLGVLEENPALRIELAAPPAAEFIFRDIDRVRVTTLPKEIQMHDEAQRLLRDWLRRTTPDLIVAPYLFGPWGPALVRMRELSGRIAGFDKDDGLERMIDRERIALRVTKDLEVHETVNLMSLFNEAGLKTPVLDSPADAHADTPPPAERPPVLRSTEAEASEAADWIESLGSEVARRPLMMLNPDAGKPFKEWPAESWAELIGGLQGGLIGGLDHTFVINASRVRPELEEVIADRIGETPRIVWLRSVRLEVLFAVLSRCTGIITVDAAPQHFAHAARIPSLTLFGPMDERRWAARFEGAEMHQTIRGCMFDLTAEELRGLPADHIMRCLKPEAVLKMALAWFRVNSESS